MLNIVEVKAEIVAALELGDHPNVIETNGRQCLRFIQKYGLALVELAELGYDLSRIAACSEKRNQPQFLLGLFEAVENLQSKITDGKRYMQRNIPDVEQM